MVEISVVVCTIDPHRFLARAVETLMAQSLPDQGYEVVVVSNGANVDAGRLLREVEGGPPLRCFEEPRLGLSRARNRGAGEARGRLIAFMDDDATADPIWLESLVRAFDEVAGGGAVGGRIELEWPGVRPAWVSASIGRFFSELDLGAERRLLEGPEHPFGANVCFRRDLFEQAGGFDERLGRAGASLISGEEYDLIERIRALGGVVVYEPTAVVTHHVAPERLRAAWLARRAFAQGRTDRRLRGAKTDRRQGLRGVPVALLRVPYALLRRPGLAGTVESVTRLIRLFGLVYESVRLSLRGARPDEDGGT